MANQPPENKSAEPCPHNTSTAWCWPDKGKTAAEQAIAKEAGKQWLKCGLCGETFEGEYREPAAPIEMGGKKKQRTYSSDDFGTGWSKGDDGAWRHRDMSWSPTASETKHQQYRRYDGESIAAESRAHLAMVRLMKRDREEREDLRAELRLARCEIERLEDRLIAFEEREADAIICAEYLANLSSKTTQNNAALAGARYLEALERADQEDQDHANAATTTAATGLSTAAAPQAPEQANASQAGVYRPLLGDLVRVKPGTWGARQGLTTFQVTAFSALKRDCVLYDSSIAIPFEDLEPAEPPLADTYSGPTFKVGDRVRYKHAEVAEHHGFPVEFTVTALSQKTPNAVLHENFALPFQDLELAEAGEAGEAGDRGAAAEVASANPSDSGDPVYASCPECGNPSAYRTKYGVWCEGCTTKTIKN